MNYSSNIPDGSTFTEFEHNISNEQLQEMIIQLINREQSLLHIENDDQHLINLLEIYTLRASGIHS